MMTIIIISRLIVYACLFVGVGNIDRRVRRRRRRTGAVLSRSCPWKHAHTTKTRLRRRFTCNRCACVCFYVRARALHANVCCANANCDEQQRVYMCAQITLIRSCHMYIHNCTLFVTRPVPGGGG